MNYPLQALIAMGVVPTVQFPTDSRYYGSQTLTYTSPSGQVITYLARRIVPQPGASSYSTIAQYTTRTGDRLDLIAAKYVGDPLLYWLLCDANGARNPNDLESAPGTTLAITMPRGIPGGTGA